MGTEIRTFDTLKELTAYLAEQVSQYKALFEDYSEWLGTILRSYGETHKDDEWYRKSAELQKNLSAQARKVPKTKDSGKKSAGKKAGRSGKTSAPLVWFQSGNLCLSSVEQGQAEILFEAIEGINEKIQEIERSRMTLQQLERLGLGVNVDYIVYIEDDVPKKIALRTKDTSQKDESFKFATELSVQALFNNFTT